MMENLQQIKAEIEDLRQQINHHNYAYYVEDAPTVSDAEYDQLMHRLRALEEKYPELITPDSPTQRVGAAPAQAFGIVEHRQPLLSLADVGNEEELKAWYKRVSKLMEGETCDFVCEHKIDGLAIALTYRNGRLEVGATRGDGLHGENITQNVRTIRSVPLSLPSSAPPYFEVRGEVYLPRSGFKKVNDERAAQGLSLFANPRNAAAGSVRQLDPRITAARPLSTYIYHLGWTEDGVKSETHWEDLHFLKSLGFRTNPHSKLVKSLDEAEAFYREWLAKRDELPYEADGIVIKVNQHRLQEKLGSVGREPRWAIAYKFPPIEGVTKLKIIEITVGRTGTLNPNAVLDPPISVGGVTISRASLHNEDDIRRKDIREGDTVVVRRAGDVIPEVVGPVLAKRTGHEPIFDLLQKINSKCPSCGTPVNRVEGEAMYYCTNSACPAQLFEHLQHFASRGAMDIRGIGEAMATILLEQPIIKDGESHRTVKDVADVYYIDKEKLAALERKGEKSAGNLMAQVEKSKTRPLARIIFALGIRHVGGEMAERLVKAYPDIDALSSASAEELMEVPTVGPRIAESVASFFRLERNCQVIEKLKRAGVKLKEKRSAAPTGPLAGMEFVITGRLQSSSREDAEERIKALGGSAKSDITKKTTYLVVGEDPGSKLQKAREMGVKQIDEQELLRLLNEKPSP